MRNAGPASLTLLRGEGHPGWPELRDLAFTLATEAAALTRRLAPGTATAVRDLVCGMNCYDSNLIEGHDTRPVDIERALRAEMVLDPKRRDLQLEAAPRLMYRGDRQRRPGHHDQVLGACRHHPRAVLSTLA